MAEDDLNNLFGGTGDKTDLAPGGASPKPGPDKTESLVGTKIGNAVLQKQIGKGGMGSVYLAHHAGLNKPVAIKIMSAELIGSVSNIQRFMREAQMAASLEHPNVVQVYDVGEAHGLYYITMQYVVGRSLDKVLEEKGRMALSEVIPIIKGVARALDAAHLRGVVHRDIKPANLLLAKDGTIKVADFGLARIADAADGLSMTGQIVGTPFYMSPEQAQGTPVDVRSDLYSLGATFFHLVTGQRSFDGDTALSILLKHLNEAPLPPHVINKELPASISPIILRMMAKSPAARYPSGEAVVRALEAFESGRATEPVGPDPAAILSVGDGTMLDLTRPTRPPATTVLPGDGTMLDLTRARGSAPENVLLPAGDGTMLDLPTRGPVPATPPTARKMSEKGGAKQGSYEIKDTDTVEARARAEGKQVWGKYQLLRELRPLKEGVAIWEAQDLRNGRHVALRVLKVPDSDAIRRFYKLAADGTNLQHPNILKVYETGNDIDEKGRVVHFMALELVQGVTLDIVLAGKMLSQKQTVELFMLAAEALEYAHKKHVLSTRMTPAEIQVSLPARPVLSFYELALAPSAEEKKESKEEMLKAAAYMAPEQVPGAEETVDERTDIYRLGAMLYEAIVGKPAFSASTQAELHRRIYQEDAKPPAEVSSALDGEIDAIIRKAMHRAKELRYQTAEELAAALRRYLKLEVKPAAATTRKKVMPKSLKVKVQIWLATNKSKLRLGGVFAMLALALVGAFGWKLYQNHLKDEAFVRNYTAALRFHQEGKLQDAISAAQQAVVIKENAEMSSIIQDCRWRILEGETLKSLEDFELASYSKNLDASAYELRRTALELQSARLSATASEVRELPAHRVQSVLGYVALGLGDLDTAETLLLRAMSLGATDSKVGMALARTIFLRLVQTRAILLGFTDKDAKIGKIPELLARLGQAVARAFPIARTPLDEQAADAYASLARGDVEGVKGAAEQWLDAHKEERGTEEFRVLLGWVSTEALKPELDKALEQRPHYYLGSLVRGARREEVQNLDGALTDYSEVCRLQPRSPAGYLLRGRVQKWKGNLEGAVGDLLQARKFAPTSWEMLPYLEEQIRAVPVKKNDGSDAPK